MPGGNKNLSATRRAEAGNVREGVSAGARDIKGDLGKDGIKAATPPNARRLNP